jgi:hypothetical protein
MTSRQETNLNRHRAVTLLALSLSLAACSTGNQPAPANSNSQATQASPPSQQQDAKTTTPGLGEASGTYTVKGETIALKYAYAGRGERFGEESIIVLLTDKPIPPDKVAEEIESQTMLLAEQIRGLEYVIDKNGYWVRFHPSQYQESRGGTPKEFVVENDTVRGRDEDTGSLSESRYSRSVSFEARLGKN